jgi:hypothetical protein
MTQHSAQPDRTPGEPRALRSFDGARLEYEVAGTGPPWSCCTACWPAGKHFLVSAARWEGSTGC